MKHVKDFLDIILDGEDDSSGACLPNPIDYYYYKGLREGFVVLNDDVGDDIVERVILPLQQLDLNKEVEHITFYINSSGGDPQDGMAVVSCLENMSTPITLRILGRACSAACYIAMAKGPHIKTVCGKYSIGLIHAGSVNLEGDAMNARDTQAFLSRYEEILKDFVCSHTKITPEKYEKIERLEFWITADDMLELEIVDEIV